MTFKTFVSAMAAALMINGTAQAAPIKNGDKILVVYFSQTGHTQAVAEEISRQTGAGLFELKPQQPYTSAYRELTEQAKKEIEQGYRPALSQKPDSIDEYNVIFVGSPCWWGTIASPVATFLTSYDFGGKTVIPFMTHGGSGLGHSVSDIEKLVPAASVTGAKAFWGSSAGMARRDIEQWLEELKND